MLNVSTCIFLWFFSLGFGLVVISGRMLYFPHSSTQLITIDHHDHPLFPMKFVVPIYAYSFCFTTTLIHLRAFTIRTYLGSLNMYSLYWYSELTSVRPS